MRLLRHLNWVIAIALAAAGVAIIRWPFLTLDTTSSAPTTAATLAGALFGAAALFAGAQINELVRHQDTVRELQAQQRRLRAALDNEFVRVCVNLMQDATHLLLIRSSIMAIDKVLANLHHDLETAEEAARKIWPTRKIKPPGEEAYVLAVGLRNQANAVAEALRA